MHVCTCVCADACKYQKGRITSLAVGVPGTSGRLDMGTGIRTLIPRWRSNEHAQLSHSPVVLKDGTQYYFIGYIPDTMVNPHA